MISWPRRVLSGLLTVVHKGLSFSLGGCASWRCILELEMGLIHAWSRDSRQFLSHQVRYFFAARVTFLLACIFLNKSALVVESRPGSLFSLTKFSISKLATDFAARVGDRIEIGCCFGDVMAGGWCFFCFGEVSALAGADEGTVHSCLFFGVIDSGTGFVAVVVQINLPSRFATIS